MLRSLPYSVTHPPLHQSSHTDIRGRLEGYKKSARMPDFTLLSTLSLSSVDKPDQHIEELDTTLFLTVRHHSQLLIIAN